MSLTLKNKVTGNPQTDLDPILTGLQWGDGFDFGRGVDAITGGLTASALKPFNVQKRTVKTSSQQYRFIQDQSDLNREIDLAASGKYNIEGVTLSASTQYVSEVKFSELALTLIAQYESHYAGYDQAEHYELTDDAKKLISNPADFRKVYGDYFIAGGQRGSTFTAIYTCQARSVEDMDKFRASMKGEAPEVFTAEGSVSFQQAASSSNISIACDVKMDGYEGNAPVGPWNPETIIKALGWFVEHEAGIYQRGLLQQYSTVDPLYPRSIDIAPSAFTDLHLLYLDLWDIKTYYASCPQAYQSQYASEYNWLTTSVAANTSSLARDADLRLEYQQRASVLLDNLKEVFARLDFYSKVKAALKYEPKQNDVTKESGGVHSWLYGYNSYPQSTAVVISSTDLHIAEDWHIGWREHTFEFGPNDNYLIVGWEVIANWSDGTDGEWSKVNEQILLTNHAAVHVKSLYDRGYDWGLRVYYVNAKDYQFGTSAKAPSKTPAPGTPKPVKNILVYKEPKGKEDKPIVIAETGIIDDGHLIMDHVKIFEWPVIGTVYYVTGDQPLPVGKYTCRKIIDQGKYYDMEFQKV